MNSYKITATVLLSLIVTFGLSQSAFAQTVTSSVGTTASSPICFPFPVNVSYGENDGAVQDEVTSLQTFLSQQGYFSSAYIGTGHFGPLTLLAVKEFQAARGIPTTGFVGPLTRAAITASCGVGTNPPPVTSPVTLYSISPTSGSTGTSINITGYGFTSSNTILFNGNVAARNIPVSSSIAIACATSSSCHGGINQTLTFPVPSSISPNCPTGSMCPLYVQLVTPGQYSVTVQNTNGTSNTINFTVTSGTPGNSLSVTGLDAPSSLSIGQTGTWTVHVLAGSNSGNLHYSVVWGDEIQNTSSIMASQPTSTQTSATFTHTYQKSGTYSPVFTVTDDNGDSVTTSDTITVSPIYY